MRRSSALLIAAPFFALVTARAQDEPRFGLIDFGDATSLAWGLPPMGR